MDALAEARNDFYEKRRSESLPLAVGDVVTVSAGDRRGSVANVISLEAHWSIKSGAIDRPAR